MTNRLSTLTFTNTPKRGVIGSPSVAAFDALQIHQAKVKHVLVSIANGHLLLTMNGTAVNGQQVFQSKLSGNGIKRKSRWRTHAGVSMSVTKIVRNAGYEMVNGTYPCDCDPESKTIRCKLPEKEKE